MIAVGERLSQEEGENRLSSPYTGSSWGFSAGARGERVEWRSFISALARSEPLA